MLWDCEKEKEDEPVFIIAKKKGFRSEFELHIETVPRPRPVVVQFSVSAVMSLKY